jgi:hypothetical protein
MRNPEREHLPLGVDVEVVGRGGVHDDELAGRDDRLFRALPGAAAPTSWRFTK